MKNYLITLLTVLFVPFFAMQASGSATAEHKDYGDVVLRLTVPGAPSMDDLQDTIVTTALRREWNLLSREDGKVVIQLIHRNHDSKLTFIYDEDQIQVYSMSYRLTRDGRRLKRDNPTGWIRNLEKDLSINLHRLRSN
jgi:hypothetical protein